MKVFLYTLDLFLWLLVLGVTVIWSWAITQALWPGAILIWGALPILIGVWGISIMKTTFVLCSCRELDAYSNLKERESEKEDILTNVS